MTFFRTRLAWSDELRWYERAALAAWWLGQIVCAACIAMILWLLLKSDFSRDDQSGAAALLLVGLGAMIIGRGLLLLATRRRRWRRIHH
jgi:hypothetical protein